MTEVRKKECACKGIRTCLLCEGFESPNNVSTSSDMKNSSKRLYYCPGCETCFPGQVWQSCDEHARLEEEGVPLKGVTIIPDFVSEEEEAKLVETINQTAWRESQSGRRKQDYGPKANFKKKKINCSAFTGLPSFSQPLVDRMKQHELLADFIPVELCNLEYDPDKGAAIDPHFDDFWLWGERLVTLNLLSDTFYTMTLPESTVKSSPESTAKSPESTKSSISPETEYVIKLKRRNLIVLIGDARTKFMHAIRRQDITSKRLGITIRELSQEFSKGGAKEHLGQTVIDIALGFNGQAVGSVERTDGGNKQNKNDATAKVEERKLEPECGDHSSIEANNHAQQSTELNPAIRIEGETHEEKMTRDGFQQVQGRMGRKSNNKHQAAKIERSKMISQALTTSSESVATILSEVKCCHNELLIHSYSDTFCTAVIPEETMKFQQIVSYGIGSFATSFMARYQLAMLLIVKERLGGGEEVECLVYDPVWNETEKACLKELGLTVLEKDERGCRSVSLPTLFYLPHCPRELSNNLLWSNWSPQALCYLHLVSNNMREMMEMLPSHITKEDSTYIKKVVPYCTSTDIHNTFRSLDIFNEFAVHVFPQSLVDAAPEALWEDQQRPVYTEALYLNAIPPVQ